MQASSQARGPGMAFLDLFNSTGQWNQVPPAPARPHSWLRSPLLETQELWRLRTQVGGAIPERVGQDPEHKPRPQPSGWVS